MAITDLQFGQKYRIKDIDSNSSYLLELGFVPGEEIELISKSPFKGPYAFRIKGTTIALRYEEAQRIKC
jgi:ferrous iron transport protein A